MARLTPGADGAYGLRVSGIESELLVSVPHDWPLLEVGRRAGNALHTHDTVTEEHAEIVLEGGGEIHVERNPLRAIVTLPSLPGDSELVHPYLAPVAAVIARWLGRETFHAGSFVVDGGAWCVLGGRESGKSSVLARLALWGHPVLSDDAVVVSGQHVFVGPRSIDLRAEAAERLESGTPVGWIGTRERWRLTLGPVDSVVPLAGWIFLAWDSDVAVSRLPVGERLTRIASQRAVHLLPRDPGSLLALAALPGLELRRPRDWRALDESTKRLLEAIG